MNEKSNWNFYGVKIIKQIMVEGEPDFTNLKKSEIDDYYADDTHTFEESIMLVYAQSPGHAYKIAEKKTTKQEHENIYQNMYKQKTIDFMQKFRKMKAVF